MIVQLHSDVSKALQMLRFDDEYDIKKILRALKNLELDPCPRDTAFEKVKPVRNLHNKGVAVYTYRYTPCNEFRFFFCVNRRKNELYVLDMIRRDDNTYRNNSNHYLEIEQKYKLLGCKR